MNDDATNHRLTNLEIKLSFTEEMVEQLNQVLVRQQNDISALVHELARLRLQLTQGSSGATQAADELPPHY